MQVKKIDGLSSFNLKLQKGGNIMYIANFLETKTVDKLMNHLLEDIEWVHGEYNMFGIPIKTPRLLAAMGELNEKYRVTDTYDFTPQVNKIKRKIENEFNRTIQYAQLNYYRDGNDYIGWHTDKEVENGDFIYSISLGAPRRFQLRPIKYREIDDYIKYDITLASGSLIILDQKAVKLNYKHQLAKDPKTKEGRINVTFRNK